ncbi:Proteasome inhibitor-related protein [Spatholobus suberectus]|nr:Proteasome inhibitor-related protein [Spatholobus suberectus]
MEGRKQMGSSSFTSELFGSNQSQKSSASGIFESLFSPPSKVLGRESLRSEVSGKTATEGWSSIIGIQDYISKGSDAETQSTPCHLSSSLYYGGQDIYSRPKSTKDSGLNSLLHKKDGVEDDSGSASRGNWWKGSLYY